MSVEITYGQHMGMTANICWHVGLGDW